MSGAYAGRGAGGAIRHDIRAAAGRGVADWLGLAAAPTFAIMALLTATGGAAAVALLGGASRVAARRNGPDVPLDERFPFGPMAEADLRPAKRRAKRHLTSLRA